MMNGAKLRIFSIGLYGSRSAQQRVPVHRDHAALASICLLTLSSLGCSEGGASFNTRLAADFSPARHTVSVLGVYQDGRMALGSWDVLGPYLAKALGPAACPVGYDALAASNQDLANAIDEYARDEGPTGNLLTQVAPAALGDLILVVSFAGKLPAKRKDTGAPEGAPVNTSMGSSRHRGHRSEQATPAHDDNQLDISASLFSVPQNRPVALVSMQYRGESVPDALTRFAHELGQAAPELKCAGWNFSVNIDPKSIRPPLEVPSAARE
jgi:hypothetical protein